MFSLLATAVINTNYALPANLNPVKDAIIIEGKDSLYANILVVRKGDEGKAEIKALVKVLNSEDVRMFIEDKYKGLLLLRFRNWIKVALTHMHRHINNC